MASFVAMSRLVEEVVIGNYEMGYKEDNPLIPYHVFPEPFLFEKSKNKLLGLNKMDQSRGSFHLPSSTENIHILVIDWEEYQKYQHQNNSHIIEFCGAIEQPQFRSNLKRFVLILPLNPSSGLLFSFFNEMLSGGTIEWFIFSSIGLFSRLYHPLVKEKQKIICSSLKYLQTTVGENQDSDSENLKTILSLEFKSLKYLKLKFVGKISCLPTLLFPKNLTSLFIEQAKPNREFFANLPQILDQSELPNLKHLSVLGLNHYDDSGIFYSLLKSKTVYSTTLKTLYLSFEKHLQDSSQPNDFETSGGPNIWFESKNPSASEEKKTSLEVLIILRSRIMDPEIIGLFIKNCPKLKLLVKNTIEKRLEKYIEHVPEIWTDSYSSNLQQDRVDKTQILSKRKKLAATLADYYSNLESQ